MKVFNYDPITFEFTSESYADKSPLENDIYLIPAFSTAIVPPDVSKNEKQVFNEKNKSWIVMADFRSEILYSKTTSEVVEASIGDTLDKLNATKIKPIVDFPMWNENSQTWETDNVKKTESKKNKLDSDISQKISDATLKINILSDSVDLGLATNDEISMLSALKKYRVLLSKISAQTGYPMSIEWPEYPEGN